MDVTTGTDGSALACHANEEADSDFVAHYGCLYSWDDAMKACPAGWHLPTYDEFDALLTYVDAHKTSSSVFLALIPGTTDWVDFQGQGGDDFGFSALPAGYANDYLFGKTAAFWTATLGESPGTPEEDWQAAHLNLSSNEVEWDSDSRNSELSARCLKDAAPTE